MLGKISIQPLTNYAIGVRLREMKSGIKQPKQIRFFGNYLLTPGECASLEMMITPVTGISFGLAPTTNMKNTGILTTSIDPTPLRIIIDVKHY